MSREILFRGKREDNSEWIRGDLITTPFVRNMTQQNIIYILDVTKADYDCFEDLVEDNGIFEVLPETVCQYTGLTDKSGKRIFEGDIVYITPEEENFLVVWDPDTASFRLNGDGWAADFNNFGGSEMEIIDNVFDNPDLVTRNRE